MIKLGDTVSHPMYSTQGVVVKRHPFSKNEYLVKWSGPFADPLGEWVLVKYLKKVQTRKLRVRLP